MSGRTQEFRVAVEAGDLEAAVALFTEDVLFHSPIVHRPYRGREALRQILSAAFSVFENFRYVCEYTAAPGTAPGHVLVFRATVGHLDVEGVDIVHAGARPEDPLTGLSVLVRPYAAATELKERMAALLTDGGSQP